jgi:hypothetical protein
MAPPPAAAKIVGLFMDMGGMQHGYVVQNGMLRDLRPAFDMTVVNLTAIWDMNPSQQFVGTYAAKRLNPPPSVTASCNPDAPEAVNLDFSFTDPAGNTVTAFATIAFSINPEGVIVGQCSLVAGGPPHGFMAVLLR